MIFELTSNNKVHINKILSKHRCVCLYHWNFCMYCQMLMPTWKRLCNKYASDPNIIIINIEQSDIHLLKNNFKKNINGFPSIIEFINGKRTREFANKRDYKKLNAFIKTHKTT